VRRTLIHRLQKLVCRIRGHKLKVISKDLLWECQRCRGTFLSESLLNGKFKADVMPLSQQETGQPSSPINDEDKGSHS
jgi:hypothetical protein